MVGLREHIFAAVPRDSIVSLPEYDSTNRIGASFETPCGRRLVTSYLLFLKILLYLNRLATCNLRLRLISLVLSRHCTDKTC